MKCEELRALAYGYFEKLISDEQRTEIEAHTAACPPCADFVTAAGTLTCQQFTHFLDTYFEGELTSEQAATFKEHIELCPPCGDYLDSYEETIRIGKHAICEGHSIPGDVPEKLVKAILEARKREA